MISTPASKRKLPLESGSSFGFSNKKRRSVIKNLGIELLPNILFNGPSTPGSACSTSGVLDSSQNVLSSAGRSRRQPTTSARKKSRRLSSRHLINRVESGKAGCFSPKISKKEAPHKSLRLRFSLGGKSSKDAASESIGLRLAKQESATSFRFTKETEFIPSVQPGKTESKSSKFISKSEDNLLTPRCDLNAHRSLWCAETPVGAQALSGGSFTDTPMNLCLKSSYMSEPAIVVSKPPAVSSLPMKLCCASSAESLESESSIPEAQRQTGPTLLKIKKAFSESGSDLQAVIQESCKASGARISKPSNVITAPPPETSTTKSLSVPSEAPSFCVRQSLLANEQNITFGQIEIAALSPLHIDSVILEAAESYSPVIQDEKVSLCAAPAGGNNSFTVGAGEREMEMNCSKLIDALDIQSPAHFRLGVSSGRQSTPYKPGLELRNEFVTPPKTDTVVSVLHDERELSPEIGTKVQKQPTFSPHSQEAERRRVADHIQHFNKLTIYSPTGSKSNRIKSPLKFHRTPVRQTVRRINSLMGESRKPVRNAGTIANQRGQVAKAVSLESGLSPHPKHQPHHGEHEVPCSHTCPLKKPPPVPPRKSSTKSCALGDVTNKVQSKTQVDCSTNEPSGAQKPLQQLAGKDMNYYRGSPRNPLNQGRLLSATKPVDL